MHCVWPTVHGLTHVAPSALVPGPTLVSPDASPIDALVSTIEPYTPDSGVPASAGKEASMQFPDGQAVSLISL
jgi:hypothetical protein